MGFRFRKSIKLFPGVRLNLSKTGVSTSIGRPGATVNIRGRRVRGTVGLPGTGLSYTTETHVGAGDTVSDGPTPSVADRLTFGARLVRRIFGRV